MNKYQEEIHYQLTMLFVKKLYEEGVISEIHYQKMNEKMLQKYQPFLSKLNNTSLDNIVK